VVLAFGDERDNEAVANNSLRGIPQVSECDRGSGPADLNIHLILDNYGTHKMAIIRNWLARRPRFQVHFKPTHGLWSNLVERWFAELTNKREFGAAHSAALENWKRRFEGLSTCTTKIPSHSFEAERLIRFQTALPYTQVSPSLTYSRTPGTGD
jgi:transposase